MLATSLYFIIKIGYGHFKKNHKQNLWSKRRKTKTRVNGLTFTIKFGILNIHPFTQLINNYSEQYSFLDSRQGSYQYFKNIK